MLIMRFCINVNWQVFKKKKFLMNMILTYVLATSSNISIVVNCDIKLLSFKLKMILLRANIQIFKRVKISTVASD